MCQVMVFITTVRALELETKISVRILSQLALICAYLKREKQRDEAADETNVLSIFTFKCTWFVCGTTNDHLQN